MATRTIERVTFPVEVSASVVQHVTTGRYIAYCPAITSIESGATKDEAMEKLRAAVQRMAASIEGKSFKGMGVV